MGTSYGDGSVRVFEQAPTVDPKMLAADPERQALAFEHGVGLAKTMLNLGVEQQQRELESMKIKAAKSQNELDLAVIEHAKQRAPEVFEQLHTKAQNDLLTEKQLQLQKQAEAAGNTAYNTGQTSALASQNARIAAEQEKARMDELARRGVGALSGGTAATNAEADAAMAANDAAMKRGMTSPQWKAAEARSVAQGTVLGTNNISDSDYFGRSLAPGARTFTTPGAAAPGDASAAAGTGPAPAPAPAPGQTIGDVAGDSSNALVNFKNFVASSHSTGTGFIDPKGSGNPILDMARARANIPMQLSAEYSALGAVQGQLQSALGMEGYNASAKFRSACRIPGSNLYDVNRTLAMIGKIQDALPLITYGKNNPGFSENFNTSLTARQLMYDADTHFKDAITASGDPSLLQKGAQSAGAAGGAGSVTGQHFTSANTAARATVISEFANRYKQVTGRALENFNPGMTNEALLAVLPEARKSLQTVFDTSLSKIDARAQESLRSGEALKGSSPKDIAALMDRVADEALNGPSEAPAAKPAGATPSWSSTNKKPSGGPGRWEAFQGVDGVFYKHWVGKQ